VPAHIRVYPFPAMAKHPAGPWQCTTPDLLTRWFPTGCERRQLCRKVRLRGHSSQASPALARPAGQ
jgi:hypothetical protein